MNERRILNVGEREAWAGRRVLITGATGFIGHRLTGQLVAAGAEVWAGTLPEEPPEQRHRLPRQATGVSLDMQDPGSVEAAVSRCQPDVVFHLAAVGVTAPNVAPHVALLTNTGGAIALLEALSTCPVERVVLVGTSYEYGARATPEGLDPFNFYAASKVAAWAFGRAYWRAQGTPVTFARPFQVYGPGQSPRSLIPAAIRAALAGSDFPMTPGEQARDFIFVDDVVDGLVAAATAPGLEGKSIDLGSGETHTVYAAVDTIWTMTGARGAILAGALPYRPAEVMHLCADAERTAHLINWRTTTSLEEGLQQTLAAYQDIHLLRK